MHAFTRPSQQLRLKVRDAILRSLHHSSLYMRLVVANKEIGARSKAMGQVLHKQLTFSPWEGTTLLKFISGQLYIDKLAMRYGHAPTGESLSAVDLTPTHILPENARRKRPCVLAVTTRIVNWSTPPSARQLNGAEPSTTRRTQSWSWLTRAHNP
jgi:hypothetical protein